ncbi:quinone oxidoreductase family protein [Phreatobacter stygius]|nr:zinc-binding dehydrogenase [Phreatobacter stygius]
MMKAIVFDRIGSPLDDFAVLHLREQPLPFAGAGEALIRMRSASINPGDFLFIQELYPAPKRPQYPQIGGNHGTGIIAEASPEVSLPPGTLVAFSYYNSWAEYAAVPAEWLIPLPADYPIEKAAQFMNLITAWDLLEQSGVEPGQWLALTAGNSAVATMVAQMARRRGVRVAAIVRRISAQRDLTGLGAELVIELSQPSKPISEQIDAMTGGKGVNAVIDSVGGPLLADLARSLSPGGKAIIYGGFGADPFALHNFDLLMKGSAISSYVYRYFFEPPKPQDRETLQAIIALTAPADFKVLSAGAHDLDDFRTAIDETLHRPERGKRFLRM